MVPLNTVRKLEKNRRESKGMRIKSSKSNSRKQEGKGIFSSLLPLVKTVAPTISKTLGLSALAEAASEGASPLIKKISGGQLLQIPNKNLFILAQLSNYSDFGVC